jgi:thioredoxin 1
MIVLKESTFDEHIAQGNMLVFFWASWCGPCIETSYLEEFEKIGCSVGTVNCDENHDLANDYEILTVPTYIFFKDGVPVKKLVGRQTKEALQDAIQQ